MLLVVKNQTTVNYHRATMSSSQKENFNEKEKNCSQCKHGKKEFNEFLLTSISPAKVNTV